MPISKRKKLMKTLFSIIIGCVLFVACTSNQDRKSTKSESSVISVVTTTGMIGDLLENLLPEEVEIHRLMKAGVDPHYYKATQGDLVLMQQADLVVYNGLHLEGKMTEIFKKLARTKKVLAITEKLPENQLRKTSEFATGIDPHVWFDVKLWAIICEDVSKKLVEFYPQWSAEINANKTRHIKQLDSLDIEIKEALKIIPIERRVLLTAHDAFAYFGRAYAIEVKGLQGISTATEYGIKDIEDAVNMILEKQIKAVFVESSVSPKALQAVVERCNSKGHNLVIGGELFSDSMGEENTEEGTYLGMVRHNVHTIVSALK